MKTTCAYLVLGAAVAGISYSLYVSVYLPYKNEKSASREPAQLDKPTAVSAKQLTKASPD